MTLALLEVRKGKGKDLLQILLELVEPTRKEGGNIANVPHYNLDNPDKILFDELWISEEDLKIHFDQPYMKGLLERINPLLARPLILESYIEVRDIRRICQASEKTIVKIEVTRMIESNIESQIPSKVYVIPFR